jgi:competence protein ComEA
VTGARMLVAVAALLAASPALAKKPLASGARVDVNRASVSELMQLPNVGRKRAEAIAALRTRSPFRRLEDLLAVRGISAGWLEKQRPHLTVGASAGAPALGVAPALKGAPAPSRRAR